MFDLIGFWTATTILTGPAIAFCCVTILHMACTLVRSASRDRFRLELILAHVTGVCKKMREDYSRHYSDDYVYEMACSKMRNMLGNSAFISGMLSVIMFMVWVLSHDALGGDPENSMIEAIAFIATQWAPYLGSIGMMALIGTVLFFSLRKMFDVYYVVKEKLDILDKKEG